jgi:hypothetical protein
VDNELTCVSGWIMVIARANEKLHTQPIRKISHLIHLGKMVAPRPLRSHLLGQGCILHLLWSKSLVQARHTHGDKVLARERGGWLALVH